MKTLEEVNAEQRRRMIAEAAYLRAEQRGFAGGDPVEDWVAAEAAVDERLRSAESAQLIERLEQGIAAATRQLAAYRKKIAGIAAEARTEWQQDADKLAKLRDAMSTKLEELRLQGEEVGQKAKQQAEKLWAEVTDTVERFGAKFR